MAASASATTTVVFDIGNVLIRWDPRNLYRRMGYADAETARIILETGLLEVNHRQCDAGHPFGPAIAALAERHPRHREFLSAFHSRWTECLDGAIASSVETLAALRRRGTPVHAISNFSREKFDIARGRFAFLDDFDELVLSGDVGLVKPDEDIFRVLIERRSLDPATAVFIDDSAANIATAGRLGFATIHFEEATTDLVRELRSLGLSL